MPGFLRIQQGLEEDDQEKDEEDSSDSEGEWFLE
jgi:hypothetical protein